MHSKFVFIFRLSFLISIAETVHLRKSGKRWKLVTQNLRLLCHNITSFFVHNTYLEIYRYKYINVCGYAFQFLNPNEAHMIFFKFCFRWSSKFELFRFLVLKSMFFNFRFAASTLSFLLLKSIDRREPLEFGSNAAFCLRW